MSMYLSSISLAVPEADPADYTQIELIMRECILHSELDWVPTKLFRKTARLAYDVLLEMRAQSAGRDGMPGQWPDGMGPDPATDNVRFLSV